MFKSVGESKLRAHLFYVERSFWCYPNWKGKAKYLVEFEAA